MKKAIIGRKVGMTQLFTADGKMLPITVIEAGPCPVVQKKTVEHDGYEALQVGFAPIREKLVTKPMLGHFKKASVGAHRYVKEIKLDNAAEYEAGQVITVDMFAEYHTFFLSFLFFPSDYSTLFSAWQWISTNMLQPKRFPSRPYLLCWRYWLGVMPVCRLNSRMK